MENIKIEVQYFTGCPNSEKALEMVKAYISKSEFNIHFSEILVETHEDAEKFKFRGSPTILIDGNDLESLEENRTPSLSCRYYQNGLPTEQNLQDFIISKKISTK